MTSSTLEFLFSELLLKIQHWLRGEKREEESKKDSIYPV